MSDAARPPAAEEADRFDVVVVGGGSAGAVVAARLSEDPDLRVALVEAGGSPPDRELMPAAVASLPLDPEVDWMFTGDPGGAEAERRAALSGWIHEYNHHRPHTACENKPPITRLTNLSGQYSYVSRRLPACVDG